MTEQPEEAGYAPIPEIETVLGNVDGPLAMLILASSEASGAAALVDWARAQGLSEQVTGAEDTALFALIGDGTITLAAPDGQAVPVEVPGAGAQVRAVHLAVPLGPCQPGGPVPEAVLGASLRVVHDTMAFDLTHGAGAQVDLVEDQYRWWPVPSARELPDVRDRVLSSLEQPLTVANTEAQLAASHGAIMPIAEPARAARLMLSQERERLSRANLFYLTEDACMLAEAMAAYGRKPPVTWERLPSRHGMMLFERPYGGYMSHSQGSSAPAAIPIVAASWSPWGPGAERWLQRNTSDAVPKVMDADPLAEPSYIWITFWSAADSGAFGLPDDAVLDLQGFRVRAADYKAQARAAGVWDRRLLEWDNEIVLPVGEPLGPIPPGSTGHWVARLLAAWDAMTQHTAGHRRLVDEALIERKPVERRRDARRGITAASPGVRVIDVHMPAHSPRTQAADSRHVDWSQRWFVGIHKRDQCMAPHLHAAGLCTHEEITIPLHMKGPADKPLRLTRTVRRWDGTR